jgi:hypothetical protein
MKTSGFSLIAALALVPAGALAAPPTDVVLPSYVPLPDGIVGIHDGFVDYHVLFGREELERVEGKKREKVVVEGPVWRAVVRIDPPQTPNLKTSEFFKRFEPLLTKEGWKVVDSNPDYQYTLHREHDQKDSWLQFKGDSHWFKIMCVEQGTPPRTVELKPLPAEPEELKDNVELSYLPPFPGAKARSIRLVPGISYEYREGNESKRLMFTPALTFDYTGPRDLCSFEFKRSYVAAVEKAGWTILESGNGGSDGDLSVKAHYTKNGRDVYVYFHSGQFGYTGFLGDIGWAARANRLKDELDKTGHVAVYGIYFDTDKDTLKPEGEATLMQIKKLLDSQPKLNLGIEGHTDNVGQRPHNQTLSEARAASVVKWLVSHGVAASRLTPAGFADTKPVAPNDSAEGRAKNRRVELTKK